jgi:hypothetical protein
MKMRNAGRVGAVPVWMRGAILAAVAMVVSAMMPVRTEAQTTLPEVTVTAPSQPPRINDQLDHKGDGNGKSGTGGKGDENHTLEQLNQQLKRKVDETNPIANIPPLDARSSDTKIGVVNIPGVQQQYGKNFGHSVVPYRPASPVYAPLGHR